MHTFDICLYHANCLDGFTAAWVMAKRFDLKDENLIPVKYDEEPPWDSIKGKAVAIVDFSYKKDVMMALCEKAERVLVLDHHATAQDDLVDLVFDTGGKAEVHFDLNLSGAGLAWSYCWGEIKNQTTGAWPVTPPRIVKAVQDRDLWLWKDTYTRPITSYLATIDHTISNWNEADHMLLHKFHEVIAAGSAVIRYQDKVSNDLLDSASVVRSVKVSNKGAYLKVPTVNCPPHMASDTLNKLNNDYGPFAIGWWQASNGEYVLSFRSKGKVDVGKMAEEMYGGGGHANAAGARVTTLPWEDPTTTPDAEWVYVSFRGHLLRIPSSTAGKAGIQAGDSISDKQLLALGFDDAD